MQWHFTVLYSQKSVLSKEFHVLSPTLHCPHRNTFLLLFRVGTITYFMEIRPSEEAPSAESQRRVLVREPANTACLEGGADGQEDVDRKQNGEMGRYRRRQETRGLKALA